MPRAVSSAIRAAGKPAIDQARRDAPYRTGALAESLFIRVRAQTGEIDSRVPYGAGAEWGQTGKWEAFTEHYGPPPRFAWPAVEENADEIERLIYVGLHEVAAAFGWFTGRP